jgi:hypothetical protein
MISDVTRRINRALWIYSFLVVSVTGASWSVYALHRVFYTRPLFAKNDQFHDLTNFISKVAHLRGGAVTLGSVINYPAPAAFVYKVLLYTIPSHPVGTYIAFLAICVSGFAMATWRASDADAVSRRSVAVAILVTAFLGYPLWFTLDRGNIEGVVWAISAAGLCFLLRGRHRTAAVLIGIAASIKPLPILFLLLLVRRRKYKEAALGLVTTGAITLIALMALGPNPWAAFQAMKPGVTIYMARYVTNLTPLDESRFEHSLLDGMKSTALIMELGAIRPHTAVDRVPKLIAEPGGWYEARMLARIYPLFAIAGFCLLLVVFYKMPMLNQLTALTVAVTLFPLSARDYTLLYLYVSFAALLVFWTREVAVGKVVFPYRSTLALAVIYALLFAPLTFLTIYSADAKLLLLLALLFVTARSPMHSVYFEDETAKEMNDLRPGTESIAAYKVLAE